MLGARPRILAALVIAGLVIACGADSGGTQVTMPLPTSNTVPLATTPTSTDAAADQTTVTTVVTVGSLQSGASLVGYATEDVQIYDHPEHAAPFWILEEATTLGSPRVFLIETGPVDGWVEVSLPVRPNGSTGWVRTGVLDLRVLDHAIFVDLSERRLRVEQANKVVLETDIAIGSPVNPTPIGSYFVTDVVQLSDPTGPWGPFALGLSAFSDTITEFNGGDGIIGIHGTNRPASIGQPVSLGCVRVPNEVAAQLAEIVELGTPVEIGN